ncbi:hypothetical protein EV127DRAFT_431759 [Xylaria flabelliformis]|nr:hypothetical protein EV127DRAFT_431759 [Xylaria flabelliformis]
MFSIVISSLLSFLLFLDKSACSGPRSMRTLKTSDIGRRFFNKEMSLSPKSETYANGGMPTAKSSKVTLHCLAHQCYPTIARVKD